jgi:tetratricopeptide (TPR) repeat protein
MSLFFFTIILNKTYQKPKIEISKQDSAYEFGTYTLKYFSIGNQRLLSSILWIQTLLESDHEHFKKSSGNSWMYYRFNTISILDANFYENYFFGGKYLSIIKDDIYGAEKLYEKGLKTFPKDYDLTKDSAFNYYFEIKDYEKAISLYSSILNHPRIEKEFPLLPSIIARAQNTIGREHEALAILKNQFESTNNDFIKKRIIRKIYSIQSQIDLKCLNSNGKNCKSLDYFNSPYIRDENGVYRSKHKFRAFKLRGSK